MRIAIVSSEVVPFAKTGGLADVTGALPQALNYCGHEVIVIMPGYKSISDAGLEIIRLSKDISYALIGEKIKVYFIEHKFYFHRQGLYGDDHGDYADNLERFAYFCRRALDLLAEINFWADILHLHDWQASLVAVYLKNIYQQKSFYRKMKCLLSIHNLGYQGIFAKDKFNKLGLPSDLFGIKGLEFYNQVNLLKGGIVFADLINTVSPTYSREIQTDVFGFGLAGLLRERQKSLSGILNGLDYSIWDPNNDPYLCQNYSARNPENKIFNKTELQKRSGFALDQNILLVGIVSRLAEQKGFDIISSGLDQLMKLDLQLVILGTGDIKYQQILKKAVKKYPKKIILNLKFDDPLAHKIYAGSDIFLMPSGYEPCGLGQLISLRYGTIPIVFKTGGLADTINSKNGFIFEDYTPEALLKSINQAQAVFQDKGKWSKLVHNAMQANFSWEVSANKYIQLYAKVKEK